jgi:hypothetical protein
VKPSVLKVHQQQQLQQQGACCQHNLLDLMAGHFSLITVAAFGHSVEANGCSRIVRNAYNMMLFAVL